MLSLKCMAQSGVFNHKLKISTESTNAKSWEPAYSLVLSKNKIDRQESRQESQTAMAIVDDVLS